MIPLKIDYHEAMHPTRGNHPEQEFRFDHRGAVVSGSEPEAGAGGSIGGRRAWMVSMISLVSMPWG